jgi:5-aminolevulinate synthase
MTYENFFAIAIARLRDERRHRVFANLERVAARFPRTVWHAPEGPSERNRRQPNDGRESACTQLH